MSVLPSGDDDGSQCRHDRERVLHVQDILVPNGEEEHGAEDGAGAELNVLGDHNAHGGSKQLHVLVGRLVSPVQTPSQFMV